VPAGLEGATGLPALGASAMALDWPGDGPAYAACRTRCTGRRATVTLVPWFARGNRESTRWTALLPVAIG